MGPAPRIALIGGGFIAGVHATAARAAGATLFGVATSSQRSSEAAAVRLGAERAFGDAAELVCCDEVDIVHIAAPNDTHLPLALAALRAGKHVVCEKPLATSADDARALADTAREQRRVATVPFVNRFHPMVREARARVQSGELGTVRTVHGSYLQDWLVGSAQSNWRVDAVRGGPSRAFADIGSHWVDLAEFLTGCRIRELAAITSTTVGERAVGMRETFGAPGADAGGTAGAPDGDAAGTPELGPVSTEDVACVVFRMTNDVTGTVTVSQVAPGRKNRLWLELDADRHSLAFDQERAEELWLGGTDAAQLLVRDPQRLRPPAQAYATLPAGHPQGFQDCFDAFVGDTYRAIATGTLPDGLPTFEDGARSAQVVDAVLTAAQKNSWVEV